MVLNNERKNLTEKIKWLLLLRVVTLSFFFGATALFHFFKAEGHSNLLYALLVPLVTAYVISIGSALLLARIQNLGRFAHAQIDFDVLLITGTIWITGDIISPFPFLYNLAVMNGAILLFYRGAFQTAAFSSFCYATLWIAVNTWSPANEPQLNWPLLMPLVWNIGSFFAIAALSGFLARKLSEAEELLNEKQQEYQQLEALKEALLQGVGSGVAVTDAQGCINYFNGLAQQLTALSETTVRGKPFGHIFPGATYKFNGNHNGKIVADEFQFACPQGELNNCA